MQYTIWSRGRLLGETDLGFVRCVRSFRMGWFHPTAEGEKVLPIATGLPPAIQAYVNRVHVAGEPAARIGELDGTSEAADLAAAYQHLDSLELELRREDGSIVPTDSIGIQDTHRLLKLAAEAESVSDERCDWLDVDDLLLENSERDRELEESVQHDLELLEPMLGNADDVPREWSLDDLNDAELPRYQVQVLLLDDSAIQ